MCSSHVAKAVVHMLGGGEGDCSADNEECSEYESSEHGECSGLQAMPPQFSSEAVSGRMTQSVENDPVREVTKWKPAARSAAVRWARALSSSSPPLLV